MYMLYGAADSSRRKVSNHVTTQRCGKSILLKTPDFIEGQNDIMTLLFELLG